jgi:hypothetical protein
MANSVHVKLAGHPDNPARFHQQVDVTLTRQPDGSLQAAYAIRGLNIDLRIPTPHFPAPADALWRTTCCELFVGTPDRPNYREFNLSPSGQWAVYDFLDTRERSPSVPECTAPDILMQRTEDLLQLNVALTHPALHSIAQGGNRLCIALTVILEADDGSIAHWALAHPPGKPDFHHPAGFALSLGPSGFRPSLWS